MGTPSNPLRVVTPVLLLWAVVATVLALRPEAPPGAHREPGAEPEDAAALREEVEELRRLLAARQAEPDEDRPADQAGTAGTPPMPVLPEARKLLAEIRELRAGRPDPNRRHDVLGHLADLARRDRSLYLQWPEMLRGARDRDEAEAIVWSLSEAPPADPGGEIDVRLRADLRGIVTRNPRGFRRLLAADLLLDRTVPRAEDYRAVLDAIRGEEDSGLRVEMIETAGWPKLREVPAPEDRQTYLRLLRRDLHRGQDDLWVLLAEWSDDRGDYDRLIDRIRTDPGREVLEAAKGQYRLIRGREDETLRALVTVLSDVKRKRWLRTLACQAILSLHRLHELDSWDRLARDAVRAFGEEDR